MVAAGSSFGRLRTGFPVTPEWRGGGGRLAPTRGMPAVPELLALHAVQATLTRVAVAATRRGHPGGCWISRRRGEQPAENVSTTWARGSHGGGRESVAGGEVRAPLGRIDADRGVRWWGDWVGLRDVDPALSLAVAGSGAASGPGRPCSPSVPRDPGIFGLSRPALCDPGQSKAAGTSTGCKTVGRWFDSTRCRLRTGSP